MLDKSCFCTRETRLFWVQMERGLDEWSGAYTVLRAHPAVKGFVGSMALRSPPPLPWGGFYLPISSSRAGPSGCLNGAMFPVSQIFKWKPTMKVWPLRAGLPVPRPCSQQLESNSETQTPAPSSRQAWGGRVRLNLQV